MSTGPHIFLDWFCCEGGASIGYARALEAMGITIVGVDLFKTGGDKNGYSRHRYPFAAVTSDAITLMDALLAGETVTADDGTEFTLADVVAQHGSPSCKAYTIATAGIDRGKYVPLIPEVRERFQAMGKPYIIENVEQARAHLQDPVMLCGSMFNLRTADADGSLVHLARHRLFETNWGLRQPNHFCWSPASVIAGVYGGARRAKVRPGSSPAEYVWRDRYCARVIRKGGYVPRDPAVRERLMGITHMTHGGMEEALPPAYTEWIGHRLAARLAA